MNTNKIIQGKLYDVKKAKLLESWTGYIHVFRQSESLYLKTNGEYFLFCPDSRMYESYIVVFSESQAKKWCAEKRNGDQYMKIFGYVEE